MGYTSHSNSPTFDATVAAAESTRQGATAPGASQATATAAEIAFYRSVRAAQIAAGISPNSSTQALQALGTGGS